MTRVFALAKINQVLSKYKNETLPLSQLDKRLLKGFYVNDIHELENDSDRDNQQIYNPDDNFSSKIRKA